MQPVRSSNIPLRWSGETIPLPSVYKHVAPIGANHFPLCVFKVAVPSLHRFEVDDSNKVRRIRRDPTHYSRLSREGLNLATDCAQLFGGVGAVNAATPPRRDGGSIKIPFGQARVYHSETRAAMCWWLETAISRATPTIELLQLELTLEFFCDSFRLVY